jgi:hypothetical protein
MKKPWILKMILIVPLIIAAVTFGTMSLWNWLVPELFSGPYITFWQTLGLLILSKILFGGFRGRHQHHGPPWRQHWRRRMEEKMQNMTPEQREALRMKWRQRCNWSFPPDEEKGNSTVG